MKIVSYPALKTAVSNNLKKLLTLMGWTETELLLKVNEQTGKPLNLEEIHEITDGRRMPSLYISAIMANYFKVSIDNLMDPNFDPANANTRGYAAVTTPVTVGTLNPTPVVTLTTSGSITLSAPAMMTTTPAPVKVVTTTVTNSITRRKSTHKRYAKLVDSHITGCKNYALAYAIYNHANKASLTLREIGASVGCSRRALRDYMVGTTIPVGTAKKLAILLSNTYSQLGLYKGADNRMHHATVTLV